MVSRKIPQRSCTACQKKMDKRDLLRVVRSPEGTLHLDLSGKAPGRGAYICKDLGCLEKAIKNKRLSNALSSPLTDDVVAEIRTHLEGNHHG